MHKSLAILVLSMASLTANAEDITLSAEPCTATRICYNVPNDGGLTIDYLTASAQYGRVIISIDGVTYDSGLYAVYPMPELTLSNVRLYAGDGSMMTLNATYTHYSTLNHSGHNYWVQHWALDGGTVTVP